MKVRFKRNRVKDGFYLLIGPLRLKLYFKLSVKGSYEFFMISKQKLKSMSVSVIAKAGFRRFD